MYKLELAEVVVASAFDNLRIKVSSSDAPPSPGGAEHQQIAEALVKSWTDLFPREPATVILSQIGGGESTQDLIRKIRAHIPPEIYKCQSVPTHYYRNGGQCAVDGSELVPC